MLEYITVSEQNKTSRRRILLLLTFIVSVLFVTQSAFAAPIDDKKKQAAELAAQIEANGEKISVLAEKYNAAAEELKNLESSVKEAQKQLDLAEEQNKEVKGRVQKRAISMYTGSSAEETMEANKTDVNRKDQYVNIATGNDQSTLNQLVVTKETVSDRKATLENQLENIEDQKEELAASKKEVENANKKQKELLEKTKGELAQLVAQAQRQSERRATQQAQRQTTPPKSSGGNQQLPANLPAPSPKAAIAIEYARQQLGKPYKYAATGPDSFDCSGLTLRAWGAAGVTLPRVSSSQANAFPNVPLNQLQPGDLVYRPGHIGLYIGGGMMIHSPQTGDVVKISPIRNITKAARPG